MGINSLSSVRQLSERKLAIKNTMQESKVSFKVSGGENSSMKTNYIDNQFGVSGGITKLYPSLVMRTRNGAITTV